MQPMKEILGWSCVRHCEHHLVLCQTEQLSKFGLFACNCPRSKPQENVVKREVQHLPTLLMGG
jgi:hypothetical protein